MLFRNLSLRLTTLSLLAACMSGPAMSQGSRSAAPQLPAKFRQEIAPFLVTEYVKDAAGPATISQVETGSGPLGASASVLIRYPIKGHGVFGSETTYIRCIKAMTERNLSTGGQDKFTVTRSRNDGEGCGGYEKTTPYVELERMAARLRACQAKGEERCLLSTNIPEAKARKLMNQK